MNQGKIFEKDFAKSVPETCWLYRFRDNAASFGSGKNTRFSSSNICDYECLDDESGTLFLWELKTTQSASLSLSMIRDTQIESLLKASKHKLVAGFICNFRNAQNDTFFININDFLLMIQKLNKKSFNIEDLKKNHAVKIECKLKRTHYFYNILKLIRDTHL